MSAVDKKKILPTKGNRTGFYVWEPYDLNNVDKVKGKVSKAKPLHLCQRPIDQVGCKSRNVHEWQGLEGESQQANPQDRPPQYFCENLSYTEIEPVLLEDFSIRHLKPYQLTYAHGDVIHRFLIAMYNMKNSHYFDMTVSTFNFQPIIKRDTNASIKRHFELMTTLCFE
ncbi:Uncharacterized protein Fot_15975 [Forsythia ovata]|uniref:Uncharacterized protein n=1 Tax=Forsythia ovata TaxID=205694 RepID=A0ABD1WAX2_9LAMI